MIPDVGYMGYMYRLESQCLKITEKVAFNIASEESYFSNWMAKSLLKMVDLASTYVNKVHGVSN